MALLSPNCVNQSADHGLQVQYDICQRMINNPTSCQLTVPLEAKTENIKMEEMRTKPAEHKKLQKPVADCVNSG